MVIFGILIILASLILGLIVLIQNPKGGGLSGTFGGLGNQIMGVKQTTDTLEKGTWLFAGMGVKQTTDTLEKGTWLFAGIVALLCIFSSAFISNKSSNAGPGRLENVAPIVPKPTNTNNTPAPETQKKP
jgi:preprotein translocase subunit SecG